MGPVGHQILADRKSTGAHYTPKSLADFVASQIVTHLGSTNKTLRVLDPSVGDGELLVSLGRKLSDKKISFTLTGYDIDSEAINVSDAKLEKELPAIDRHVRVTDFIEDVSNDDQPNLFKDKTKVDKVDIVIANPPYIRTQVLGSSKTKQLSKQFGISGRLDMYQVFVGQISSVMNEGGLLGIILSNRFMYTQSGKSTRDFILKNFDVLGIWDLGDTKVFEAAVLPVVLVLRKKKAGKLEVVSPFVSIYSTKDTPESEVSAVSIFDHLQLNQIVNLNDNYFKVKVGTLHAGLGEPWRISADDSDGWLGQVDSNTYCHFGDIAKIKVGVKTTADKVFIHKNHEWAQEAYKPEVLLPLVTHHIAKRYHAPKPTYSILYPHILDDRGKKKPINLEQYPLTKKYLLKHEEKLKSRTYVIDSGRQWYEIWVPHNPADWSKPKIIFRDISEKPTFWAEFDTAVVNGDCYWMAIPEDSKDITWLLLAIANSTFIEEYYDHKFSNKLYSGRRRYITQYVSKFPVLDPALKSSKTIIELSKSIYELALSDSDYSEQESKLNQLVYEAFGLNQKMS